MENMMTMILVFSVVSAIASLVTLLMVTGQSRRRGIDDQQRGIDDQRRGIDDQQRGIDDQRRGIDDQRRGIDDQRRGIDDQQRSLDGRGGPRSAGGPPIHEPERRNV